jgi:hypothetical protein
MTKGLLAKKCRKCGEWKALGEFKRSSKTKSGVISPCKSCLHITEKARRERYKARAEIAIPATKSCPVCREVKPAAEFGRDLSRTSGLRSDCRACKRAASLTYSDDEANRARKAEVSRARYRHPEVRAREQRRDKIEKLTARIAVKLCRELGIDVRKLAMEKYDAELKHDEREQRVP